MYELKDNPVRVSSVVIASKNDKVVPSSPVKLKLSLWKTKKGMVLIQDPGSFYENQAAFDMMYALWTFIQSLEKKRLLDLIAEAAVKPLLLDKDISSMDYDTGIPSGTTITVDIEDVETKAKLVAKKITDIIMKGFR